MNKENNEKKTSNIPEQTNTKPMDSKKDVEQSPDEKTDQDFPGYPHYPAKEDIMDQRTDSHRVDVNVESLPNSRNMTGVSQRFTGTENQDEEKKTKVENEFEDLNPRTEVGGKEGKGNAVPNAEIGVPHNVESTDLRHTDLPGTDLEEEENDLDKDAMVSPEERAALENMSMPSSDNDNLRRAALDNTDFDGDVLNEESFGPMVSGDGLDIPEAVDETESESMGQGDEENKYYSLGGDRHDAQDENPYSDPVRGQ